MDLELNNKLIIVTGGAKGIGRAIVQAIAEEGAIPVIIGRNEEENKTVLEELKIFPKDSFSITAELSHPEECVNAVDQVIKKFSRIDGIVNNAGQNDGVGLEEGDYDGFIKSLYKNVVHYYMVVKQALPYLKKSRGPIVNISSKVAETGQGNTSGYAAANGARNALTREWAVELLKYEIRVNAIIVAECYTPLYEKWLNTFDNPQERKKAIGSIVPLENRMTKPEEIASMAAFLLSSRSSHITGQLIHVDGGYVHLDRAIGQHK